jgi:hypothetical protein
MLGLAGGLSVAGAAAAQSAPESPPPPVSAEAKAPASATPPEAPPTTFSLELAATGCSTTVAQLGAAILMRVPTAQRVESAAEVAIHAEIVNGGTSSLTVSLLQGSSRREFQGASCEEATAIIAFISSLVLDARPEERLKATELAAVPESAEAKASKAKAEDKPPPEPEPSKSQASSQVDAGEPAPGAAKLRFGLSAAFTLETAIAPSPPPGGLFGFNLRWERPSWLSPEVRAELLVTSNGTKDVENGQVSLRLTAGRLSACPVRLRGLKGAFLLGLCATFDGGFLRGQASDSLRGQPNSLPWVAVGASLLAEIPVSEAFELQLLAGLKFLPGDEHFVLDADPSGSAPSIAAYDVPAYSGGFAVGIGFRP